MSAPAVQAIETHYAGCRFRSRLEARWAVMLDAKGLPWEYEPEGFETPCGRYLPDFRVTLLQAPPAPSRIWLEIKPQGYSLQPTDLGRWIAVSRATGMLLLVACGLDDMMIVVTPEHTYSHFGPPGFIGSEHVDAGRSARFEFGESGASAPRPDDDDWPTPAPLRGWRS